MHTSTCFVFEVSTFQRFRAELHTSMAEPDPQQEQADARAQELKDERAQEQADERAQELEALRCMYPDELREGVGALADLEVDIPCSLDTPREVACGATVVSVRHLSLTLRVRAPPGYPASAPPHFAIVASWLDPSAHAHLLTALAAEWEGARECVLIRWIEQLRADAPAAVGRIVLADCARGAVAPVAGGVIVREPAGARRALAAILAEDARRVEAADGSREVRCGVCLEMALRLSCPRFANCAHRFCRACLRTDLEGRIRQGDASALGCPECRQPLLPTEVRALVSAELYSLHETRSLHSSLAGMDDVVWCPLPHCQSPVVLERGAGGELEQLGRCAQCGFAFCILCQRSWHGDGPCSDFKQKWDAASPEERAALEERFGAGAIAEMQSSAWIASVTQACPCCRASTEKNGGCNHITCAKCAHEWCWLCRGRYTHGHYALTACSQFSADFYAEVAQALAEEGAAEDAAFESGVR